MTSPHHTPSPELAAIIAETRAELLADRAKRKRVNTVPKPAPLSKDYSNRSVAARKREAEKREGVVPRVPVAEEPAPIGCGICRGKCGCRAEIPRSDDPRWPIWVAMPRKDFSVGKRVQLGAWADNDAADKARPVGCIDVFGRRAT